MNESKIGQKLLVAIKETAGLNGPQLVIPVGRPPIAFLRPTPTKKELLNEKDVQVLTEWRNRFVHSFLTEFEATESRTARWLSEVVGPNEQKILFMVDDLNGVTFGYMGLDYINWVKKYGEADAVVRGRESAHGTMKFALQTMLSWARGTLGLHELYVRVRSDNTALKFYQKAGFHEVRRVPLKRVKEPDMIRYVEDESLQDAKVYLVYMRWQPSKKDNFII